MRAYTLFFLLVISSMAIAKHTGTEMYPVSFKAEPETAKQREPASTKDIERLIEIDKRSGCCSHHGGASYCNSGKLYCNDGWTSGCGC